MGWLLPDKTVEHHEDGSSTTRYEDVAQTSVTENADGTVREWSRDENALFFDSLGQVRVTRDSDDNVINVQSEDD
jgi:hypothetical protein